MRTVREIVQFINAPTCLIPNILRTDIQGRGPHWTKSRIDVCIRRLNLLRHIIRTVTLFCI